MKLWWRAVKNQAVQGSQTHTEPPCRDQSVLQKFSPVRGLHEHTQGKTSSGKTGWQATLETTHFAHHLTHATFAKLLHHALHL